MKTILRDQLCKACLDIEDHFHCQFVSYQDDLEKFMDTDFDMKKLIMQDILK